MSHHYDYPLVQQILHCSFLISSINQKVTVHIDKFYLSIILCKCVHICLRINHKFVVVATINLLSRKVVLTEDTYVCEL